MTLLLTKPAADVFAPTTGGGDARAAVMGQSQVWGIEIERYISAAFGVTSTVQGGWSAASGVFPGSGTAAKGHTYLVTTAGTTGGQTFRLGDMLIAIATNASTATYAGNWVRFAAALDPVVQVADAGAGTSNAIQATAARQVSGDGGQILSGVVFETNTSTTVTISITDSASVVHGPYTIKTASGNSPAVGGLPAGLAFAGQIIGSEFRLLSDQSGAAIQATAEAAQAAAETARAAAEAAASSVQTAVLSSRAYAEASFDPVVAPTQLIVFGYAALGDCPPISYKLVGSEPAHDAKMQILEGSWYEFSGPELNSTQVAVAAADAAATFQNFLDAAAALDIPAIVPRGVVYDFPTGSIDLPEGIDLRMKGATLRRTADLTIPLLQCVGASGARKKGIKISGGLLKYTAGTTATSSTNSAAVWLKFCKSSHVEDVIVEGAFYMGFRYDDCIDCTLDQFEVWGAYNRAVYIGAVEYTENIHVSRGLCDGYAFGTTTPLTNHIVNTNGYGTGTGRQITFDRITVRNAIRIGITGDAFTFSDRIFSQKAVNCRAVNCPTGFLVIKANTYSIQDVEIVNCEAATCDRGIYGIDAFSLFISNFKSRGHAVAGIHLTNCAVVTVTGGQLSGIGSGSCDGLLCDGTTGGVTINGVVADNNTVAGFKSTSGCSNIVGRGNYSVLNGTGANMNGVSGIDFPTSAGSGNLIL